MASIRKLKSGKFQVQYRDADGRQRGKACTTEKAARLLRAQIEAAVLAGRSLAGVANGELPGVQIGATFGELLDYHDRMIARHGRDYASNRQRMERWRAEIGEDTSAAEVGAGRIVEAATAIRATVGASTLMRYLESLSGVFTAIE